MSNKCLYKQRTTTVNANLVSFGVVTSFVSEGWYPQNAFTSGKETNETTCEILSSLRRCFRIGTGILQRYIIFTVISVIWVGTKMKETSNYKHSLRESWWYIGFEGNWLCKKQGNKVLSEGKM